MRKFAGKIQTKEVAFMGDKIEIRKLSTGAVRRIGVVSSEAEAKGEAADSLEILLAILTEGVVLPEGEEAIDAELLDSFPIDELNILASDIMKYAGVIAEGNEG